jgi:hypothetical protein
MPLRSAALRMQVLGLVVVVAACTGKASHHAGPARTSPASAPSSSPTAARTLQQDPDTLYTVPSALLRPLHPHPLATGCATGRNHPVDPAFGPGLGRGPIYPVVGTKDGVVPVQFPPPADSGFANSAFSGQKILWVGTPAYRGPVLIRGYAIDGSRHQVRFGAAIHPYAAMQLPPQGADSAWTIRDGWRNWPSLTRVSAPGCYAWQVDGRNFSYEIDFRVVPQRTQ